MTEVRPIVHQDVTPEELRVSNDGLTLILIGCGTRIARIASGVLRSACRCSGCRSLAIQGRPVPLDDRIRIDRVVPMGGAAANIVFSDGHGRGVFPWDYLWTLAASSTASMDAAA